MGSVLTGALLALFLVLGAQAADRDDDGPNLDCCPPGFIHTAKENNSPLITDANPLHKAVAYFDMAGVKAAVEQKRIDVNKAVQYSKTAKVVIADKTFTPLQVAIESTARGSQGRYYSPRLIDIVFYLLCKGANPNTVIPGYEDDGVTFLHKAAATGNYRLVYAMLLAGAYPNSPADYGYKSGPERPIDRAKYCDFRNSWDIGAAVSVALLRAFGAKTTKCEGHPYCTVMCEINNHELTATDIQQLRKGKLPDWMRTKLVSKMSDGTTENNFKIVQEGLDDVSAKMSGCPAVRTP